MKKLLIIVLAVLLNSGIVYASGGYEYKGSHSEFDITAEAAILNKIESQTDPATEKVKVGRMVLKFEYFTNTFGEIDGQKYASVHFSDNNDQYVFDYYVEGDSVIKILLYTKNGTVINKQVYPEIKGSDSDRKK